MPVKFLSTLSLRRATTFQTEFCWPECHFYPRSPCGERLDPQKYDRTNLDISIHALLAESDPGERHASSQQEKFLSTLSLRRATARPAWPVKAAPISIHALLAESDGNTAYPFSTTNPFLSTLSLRRATSNRPVTMHTWKISIHALLAESDAWNRFTQRRDFISIHALLAESDHMCHRVDRGRAYISIHALLAESDPLQQYLVPSALQISIHALLAESDGRVNSMLTLIQNFYPRSPCGERRRTSDPSLQ